jgi:DNA-binding CsgD family transcriptional regulator
MTLADQPAQVHIPTGASTATRPRSLPEPPFRGDEPLLAGAGDDPCVPAGQEADEGSPEPEDPEVVALLSALLHRYRRVGNVVPTPEGILLDVVVGGVRCMLVCSAATVPRAMATLSPREREIARMVSLGHTNKTIADVLEISLWTVSTHLRRIFAKLGVSTRAAMIGVLSGNPELARVPGSAAEKATDHVDGSHRRLRRPRG